VEVFAKMLSPKELITGPKYSKDSFLQIDNKLDLPGRLKTYLVDTIPTW